MTCTVKAVVAIAALLAVGGSVFMTAYADEDSAMRPRMTVLLRTENVLGRPLTGASGERAGLIADVLADPSGRIRAAIVDYGGFLGVGSRRIAIDWEDLRFEGNKISVDLTRDRLRQAPEVKEGRPVFAISAKPARDRADARQAVPSP